MSHPVPPAGKGPDPVQWRPEVPLVPAVLAPVFALSGVTALVGAQVLPWVSVRTGGMFPGLAPATVGVWYLHDLSGAAIPLHVGWAGLVGLIVAAWARPSWRRYAFRAAVGLSLVLVFLICDLGQAAIEDGGYDRGAYPDASLQAGALLGMFGTAVLVLSVAALARSTGHRQVAVPPPPDVPGQAPPAPPTVPVPTPQTAAPPAPTPQTAATPGAAAPPPARETAAPPAAGGAGWSARPVWVPWWRRRGPRTAAIAGAVVTAVLLATTVWMVAHRPAPPPWRTATLDELIIEPTGVGAPVTPPDIAEQLDLRDVDAASVLFGLTGVRQSVGRGWTESDGTFVTTMLLRFGSPESAEWFATTCRQHLLRQVGQSGAADLPDLGGASAFTSTTAGAGGVARVRIVAHRGDVVVLVTETASTAVSAGHAHRYARDQYHRL
ncbi:hypothetical protein [Micromonospora echinofusca]|uniref:Uncharacterized protein n=1 Tax=Micromonospora echinofusca TaxID=47858 RepID=A0ABS3VQL2_MICEH|nr:hypothetical protein [Micromonospora echinofusca]MBO4206830.1 hypothetical protein [Micromonospora echinofusca]